MPEWDFSSALSRVLFLARVGSMTMIRYDDYCIAVECRESQPVRIWMMKGEEGKEGETRRSASTAWIGTILMVKRKHEGETSWSKDSLTFLRR